LPSDRWQVILVYPYIRQTGADYRFESVLDCLMCGAISDYFGSGVYDLNLQKMYLLRVSIPVPSLYVLKVSHLSSMKASFPL
jgi:hypothetical protein